MSMQGDMNNLATGVRTLQLVRGRERSRRGNREREADRRKVLFLSAICLAKKKLK